MARPLEEVVGYVLKQAAAALRAAMEATLRPLELTVAQYACLELLGQRPGLSVAELARGAFVTRQAMHGVLSGLEERGLVARVAADRGRSLPGRLTPAGESLLRAAHARVQHVEQQMLAALPDPEDRRRLRDNLAACAAALS